MTSAPPQPDRPAAVGAVAGGVADADRDDGADAAAVAQRPADRAARPGWGRAARAGPARARVSVRWRSRAAANRPRRRATAVPVTRWRTPGSLEVTVSATVRPARWVSRPRESVTRGAVRVRRAGRTAAGRPSSRSSRAACSCSPGSPRGSARCPRAVRGSREGAAEPQPRAREVEGVVDDRDPAGDLQVMPCAFADRDDPQAGDRSCRRRRRRTPSEPPVTPPV